MDERKSSMSDVEFYTKMEELMKQNVVNLVRILTRRKCILKTVHSSVGSGNLFTRSIHNSLGQNFQLLSSVSLFRRKQLLADTLLPTDESLLLITIS